MTETHLAHALIRLENKTLFLQVWNSAKKLNTHDQDYNYQCEIKAKQSSYIFSYLAAVRKQLYQVKIHLRTLRH